MQRICSRLPALHTLGALAVCAAALVSTPLPAAGAPEPAPEPERGEVTVLGEVVKPGTYTFPKGATAAAAIALAGGPVAGADLSNAVLRRDGKEFPLDLRAILIEGKGAKVDPLLQDGDVLVVPTGVRIYAYGAFARPGIVVVTSKMKLVDVLLEAGGSTAKANLARAVVVRMVDGKPKRTHLNLKEALLKAGPANDFLFQDGDVLFLPEKGRRWPSPLPEWRYPPRWHIIARLA